MQRKILWSGIAAMLLAGFAWADDPQPAQTLSFGFAAGGSDETPADSPGKQEQPEHQLPDVLFFRGDAPTFDRRILPPPPIGAINDLPNNRAPGEYWLGIACYPAMPVLRVHLNLPENQGLVVRNVVPDSPAAKAGIEENDILMQAGEKKLTNAGDLYDVVESAKETPLKMEIIHAGKPKSVEATPSKRPRNAAFEMEGKMTGAPADMKEFQQWVQKLQSGNRAAMPGAMAFRFIGPGTILPPGSPDQPPLPKNMSIHINRNNDKPAEITVKWDDKKWEITEKELDKLPDDVRPFVERMLGRAKLGEMSAEAMTILPDFTIPAPPPGMAGAPGPQMQVRPFKSVEQQLEEMNRKIDRLQKELQRRLEKQAPPAQAEEENSEDESERPETPAK